MGCNLSEMCSKFYKEKLVNEEVEAKPTSNKRNESKETRSEPFESDHENSTKLKSLRFTNNIELTSHFTHFIHFERNPLEMVFIVPSYVKIKFSMFDQNRVEVNSNCVLVQKSQETSNTLVYVALPEKNKNYYLKLYAKNTRDEMNVGFNKVTQFKLVRSESDKNDAIRFCKLYDDDEATNRCYVHSPTEYSLNMDVRYEFKYWVRDARQVVLVDDADRVYGLEKSSQEESVWILRDNEFSSHGKLTLFAQFNETDFYTGICYYQLIRIVRITRI